MAFNPIIVRVFFGMFLLLASAAASASTVVIMASRLGGGYDELIDTLRDEIVRIPGIKVQVIANSDGPTVSRMPEDSLLIVTVGLQITLQTWKLSDSKLPILSVLLPRASFDLIATTRSSRKHSAIYIDQPPSRQIELMRSVLPAARIVGLVVGPATQQDLPTYRAFANARGLTLLAEYADRETELYPVLQTVLKSADALLALPDPNIVNVSTAQNLLLTSFRFRVPVIGYSASYVRAGALAAVFSTPRQIGLEAGQIIRQYVRSGTLPPAKYPRYYSVSVNTKIADSLGLSLPEENIILQRLQQFEGIE